MGMKIKNVGEIKRSINKDTLVRNTKLHAMEPPKLLCSSFSLQMCTMPAIISAVEIPIGAVRGYFAGGLTESNCAVGHLDFAIALSELLGFRVPFVRQAVGLRQGESIVVAQTKGGRLPEEYAVFPKNIYIAFYLVTCR